jgi:tRNA(Ile)-lysidine synthase
MKNLIKKIQNNIFQNNLFEPNSSLVLAVSGGPDSVFLAEVFAQLKKKYALEIILAHVNYGLRGKESDRDQKVVEELAAKYSWELYVLHPEIKNKSNLEENLRKVRYDFFEKICQENSCSSVAVAHTLDDQVETFLMRLIRGSGLLGLSAMKFRNGKIIRPLLDISKKEILEYLKKNRIKFGTDRTNRENIFFRNKIRNKLIPFLEKNFNANIAETLFNTALNVSDDYLLLEEMTQKKIKRTSLPSGEMSVRKILSLPVSLQRMVLRKAILAQKENLRDISFPQVEEVRKILKSSKGKNQKVLFKGLKVLRKGDKLKISAANR